VPQVLWRFESRGIIIDRLAGLFAQFKPNRPSCLFLSDGCAIRSVSARSDIFDLDGNDIATAKFAIDGQIEHSRVASASFDLEFGSD
jgi:hypothetical protein